MTQSLITPSLDYTNKDFTSLRARLYNLIASVFPTWTDQNVANFGNILIELYSFVGDVLTKYQDNQARETRWSQATQRKSILALVKLIGYVPIGATAAQVVETFSIPTVTAGDVVIPAGAIVQTLQVVNPTSYQLLASVTIPHGQTSITGTVENSVPASDTFASAGTPNQAFTLTGTPFLSGSASVVATDGTYTVVPNLLNAGPTDRQCVIGVDANDRATVTFGNGINGSIPQGTITVTYKTGGGSAGRVDANTLQRLIGNYTDTLGNPVQISANNALPSSIPTDDQSVQSIQQLAPLSVRIANRSVKRDDFEIVALGVAGVARALMTTSNEDPGVLENRGILYLVPPDGSVATPTLISNVVAAFNSFPFETCFSLDVRSAPYLAVNVVAKVYRAPRVDVPTCKAAVLAALAAWFAPLNPDGSQNPNVNFGYFLQDENGNPEGLLPWGQIFDVVESLPEVRRVGAGPLDFTLNGARADLAIRNNQFPQLGSVLLVDGDTGLTM